MEHDTENCGRRTNHLRIEQPDQPKPGPEPQEIGAELQEIGAEPQDIREEQQEIGPESQKIGEESQEIGAKPQEIAAEPNKSGGLTVEKAPRKTGSTPYLGRKLREYSTDSVPHRRRHRVVLNVSGEHFETYRRTLRRFPETLLGSLDAGSEHYLKHYDNKEEYFFNRNRQCFEAILFFYQSNGLLKRPDDIPFRVFFEECVFFRLPETSVARMTKENGIIPDLWLEENRATPPDTFRGRAWNVLESPETSLTATVFGIISMTAIFVSTVLTIVGSTMESGETGDGEWEGETGMGLVGGMGGFQITELTVNVWFLLEIALRIIFCPSKLHFILSIMNCIDLIAVFPPLLFLLLRSAGGYQSKLKFLRSVRLLRVVRLMRLSKQSKRLQVVMEAIKQCATDWQMMLMCLLMAMLLGSSIMYFLEASPTSDFASIPDAVYWAIVTATSVGYGDIVPKTVAGQLFTSFFLVVTIMTVTCPIHSLVNSFVDIYNINIDGERRL